MTGVPGSHTLTCTLKAAGQPAPYAAGWSRANVLALVDYFCLTSSSRVEELFRALGRNADRKGYKLAQEVLEGRMEWLERGIV